MQHKTNGIEEMAKMVCSSFNGSCYNCPFDFYPPCPPKKGAERLYNAGYRKASEVAREIFEEIEEIAMHGTTPFGLCLMSMGEASFAKLKKKYTEGEG